MQDALRIVRPWLTFAGSVLVIAVLYWAQAVIVPVALAVLVTFVLTPVVTPLQRRIGGVAAVLVVVVLTFTSLGLAGWAVTRQLTSLVQELPAYQQNVRQKIRDVRGAGKGGSVETLQKTVTQITDEIEKSGTRGTTAQPVIVRSEQVAGLWGLPTALGPWLEPLATAGLVMALVIFMLLERQDLRNRLIRLLGHGRLAVTTRAFDEAGSRVMRYLFAQSVINLLFGVLIGVGLYAIGVPYALLWASLAAALRFVPYIGPWIAAIAPILVSLAAFAGWTRPLYVAALFVGLELFMNFVVESFFYAGVAGVSQVGLLIAFAFWTWLWGPLGLLMATPLTVCLVVIGKYVPSFEFVATLLSDETTLDADVSYYQRLLAGDHAEALDLLEQYVKTFPVETVYDAMLLPALNYAERDRVEERLSAAEEHAVVAATAELLDETERFVGARPAPRPDEQPAGLTPADAKQTVVLGWPANGEADALALRMLGHVFKGTSFTLDILAAPTLVSEVIREVQQRRCAAVCIADLPPSAPSKSRYLVKRLRAAVPDLKILVGRWAPAQLADESVDAVLAAGADHVGMTLLETREQLCRLLYVAAPPSAEVVPGTAPRFAAVVSAPSLP